MRNKTFSRKLHSILSITLSLVMLIGVCFVVPVTTAVAETETITIDFETDIDGGNTGMVSIIESTDKNGSTTKVLEVKGAGQERVERIKKSDGSDYSITKGKWKLSFDYYIPDSVGQENASIRYNVNQSNSAYGYMSGDDLTGDLISNKDGLQPNTWYSAERELTVDTDITKIGFRGFYNDPIYIDNVVFTPATTLNIIPINGINEGNTISKTIYKGEAVTLPTFAEMANAIEGTVLEGYYLDKELTNPISSIVYPPNNAEITLYAKMVAGTYIDFENDIDDDGESSIFNVAKGGEAKGKDKKTGTTLKTTENETYVFAASFTDAYSGTEKYVAIKRGDDTSSEYISLNAGTYKIEFDYLWYTFSSAVKDTNELLYFAYNTNAAIPNNKITTTNIFNLCTKNQEEWQKGSFFFVLPANAASIGFYMKNATKHIYIDNIVITPIPPAASFNDVTTKEVAVDSEGYVTAPVNDALNFSYWQLDGTDKTYNGGEKIPVEDFSENPSFTAIFNEKTTIDFSASEDGTTGNKLGGAVGNIVDDDDDEDHGKVLALTKQAADRHEVLHQKLDTYYYHSYNLNTKYKITFDYKFKGTSEGVTAAESTIYFAFGVPNDGNATMWAASKTDLIDVKTEETEWKTKSVVVSSPDTYTASGNGSNATPTGRLGVGIKGGTEKSAIVYIDNVIIEKLPDTYFVYKYSDGTTKEVECTEDTVLEKDSAINFDHWVDSEGVDHNAGDPAKANETYTAVLKDDYKLDYSDTSDTNDGYLRINVDQDKKETVAVLSKTVDGKEKYLRYTPGKSYLLQVVYKNDVKYNSAGEDTNNKNDDINPEFGFTFGSTKKIGGKIETSTGAWQTSKYTYAIMPNSVGNISIRVIQDDLDSLDYLYIKSVELIPFSTSDYEFTTEAVLFHNAKNNDCFIESKSLPKVDGKNIDAKSAVYNAADTEETPDMRSLMRFVSSYNYGSAVNKLAIGDGTREVKITERQMRLYDSAGNVIAKAPSTASDVQTKTCWELENSRVSYSLAVYNIRKEKADVEYTSDIYVRIDEIIDATGTYSVWGDFNALIIRSEKTTSSAQQAYDALFNKNSAITGWY